MAVTTGEVVSTVQARDLLRQIAEAAWECADPGLQFDTTINRWHTAPRHRAHQRLATRAREYMHLDNSACNLASLNLLKFLDDDDTFDVEGFQARRRGRLHRPGDPGRQRRLPDAERSPRPAARFRQLGLGYANLGALLMALGLPYDSDDGRAWAAAITSLMTGHAYATSARIASRMGPFAGFADNEEHMLRRAAHAPRRGRRASTRSWCRPTLLVGRPGRRGTTPSPAARSSACATARPRVLAPTGTIGLMMDCDTTGIEPDLGLVKMKKLVGGGTMSIVNQTMPRALRRLGYTAAADRRDHRLHRRAASRSSARRTCAAEHLPVFACSMGDNTIHYEGHVRMMGAVQPFISGAISKTVNMPEEATVEEVEALHLLSWELGLKAVAIYRDNCKVGQPLSTAKKDDAGRWPSTPRRPQIVERIVEKVVHAPVRQKLPRTRTSKTFEFRVADCKGFATIGEYDDGRPGEIFLTVSKQGSTLAGIMDAFAKSISLRPAVRRAAAGLRRGVHQHALRAGRHDRRPRHPLRHLDHGLPVPPPGARVPDATRSGPSSASSRSTSGCSRRCPASRSR